MMATGRWIRGAIEVAGRGGCRDIREKMVE
jgi:hypothetical protein